MYSLEEDLHCDYENVFYIIPDRHSQGTTYVDFKYSTRYLLPYTKLLDPWTAVFIHADGRCLGTRKIAVEEETELSGKHTNDSI